MRTLGVAACLLMFCAHPLRAEGPSGARAVVVGVLPVAYHGGDSSGFLGALVTRSLEAYDLRVEAVERGDGELEHVFEAHPRLDVLIEADVFGSGGSEQEVRARITWRSGRDHELSTRGPEAQRDVVSAIVENVADDSSLGSILEQRRRWALEQLEQGVDDPDRLIECLVIAGVTAREDEDWIQAEQFFERALDVRPGDALLHFDLALVYKGMGDDERKRAELERAYELDPSEAAVSIAVGNDALSNGDFDRAVAEYGRWLDSEGFSSLVKWNLAVARVRQGRFEEARAHLDEIPRASPYYPDAQAWSERLARRPAKPGEELRTSMFAALGLPAGFGETLLTVTFALSLVGFLWKRKLREGEVAPVIEIGGVKLPRPDNPRVWRFAGPILFAVSVLLFVPLVTVEPGPEAPILESGMGRSAESFAAPATGR